MAPGNVETHSRLVLTTSHEDESPKPAIIPFAGRIGGNQTSVLDLKDPRNEAILQKVPDATPFFSIKDGLSLAGFADVQLWKYALIECIGTMLLVFTTSWISIHPPLSANTTTPSLGASGIYGTTTFLGPLVGGLTNWLSLTLFIYSFANVSGAHFNPTISFATFFARLITLPRLVCYVTAQLLGGTLAGLILTRAYGSRDFEVGGCVVDTNLVPVDDALVLEFVYTLTLIFLSFGVGLDPRQGNVIGPTLSPWLVGMVLGVLSLGSSFTRTGYGGASMNPARCFGAYVGSSFQVYHWIHWLGPLAATIGHGVVYAIVPPWQGQRR